MAVESGSYTPETIARRLKMAEELMAPRKRPIIHWAQGLEDLANTAVGAMEFRKAERQEDAMEKAQALAWAKLMGGGGGAGADVPPIAPAAAAGAPGPVAGVAPPTRMAALTPDVPLPAPPKPPIDPNTLPVMNLTDPRVTPLGETIERLPPAPRPGPAVAGLPGAPMPMPSAGAPVAAALNAPATPAPPPAVPPPVPPVAAALNAPAAGAPGGDMRARIATMLESGNRNERRMAAKLAPIIAAKQLEGEKPTDEMREYQLYRAQGGTKPFVDYKADLKRAGAQNLTVSNTVNPILKGVSERFNETMDTAKTSITSIEGIHEARKALDEGAITGAGAEPKLFLAKVGSMFGLPSSAAQNTETLRGATGSAVLARAKALGANPSNTDRDYIEKVMGGQITLEEGSIRRLLDMQEKWARAAIRRANAEAKKVIGAQPKELESVAPLLSVDEPPSYEDFIKANPLATAPAAARPAVDLKKKYGLD